MAYIHEIYHKGFGDKMKNLNTLIELLDMAIKEGKWVIHYGI